MMQKIIPLNDRSILEISGSDRKKFLQGLVTNDVNKATDKNLIYAFMLTPQGRFLYDFFIFEKDEKLIVDCLESRRDEILKKLNFYKLRADVVITKNDEMRVGQVIEGDCSVALKFADPRHKALGLRVYFSATLVEQSQDPVAKTENGFDSARPEDCSRSTYDHLRISNKIPESELDLTYEKSFILEFGFDDFNAIDYNKGCYVGQELTARTHHLGEIRKKIFHVVIHGGASSLSGVEVARSKQSEESRDESGSYSLEKNMEILSEGKSVGQILSSVFYQNELHALALIKVVEVVDWKNLRTSTNLELQTK